MLIRLVGGPYNNQLIDTELPCVTGPRETYYLVHYVSGYGSKYVQYVHSSMIRRGEVSRLTYRERLARWDLPIREFNARLRRCLRTPSPAGLPSP